MIRAYNEKYLNDAMRNMGEAFDYAINYLRIEANEFMDMFIIGGFAEQFASGVPKYVSGMSGTELAIEIISRAGLTMEKSENMLEYDYSPEYWSGWMLAYYQWYTNYSFKHIHKRIPLDRIIKLYPALHEASEERCVDAFNHILINEHEESRLQMYRRLRGYSQRILSEQSGVSLRMIQQYEQKVKDINKASVTGLMSMAKVLNCRVEDLLEKEPLSK